jgi:hypothetical protein
MARLLLDAEDRAVREEFRILAWVREDFRRRRYYGRVDWVLQEFAEDGVQPPDGTVVNLLAVMVTTDDSFVSHVLRWGVANPDMERCREVCAKVIYETYIRAVEDGQWPEE